MCILEGIPYATMTSDTGMWFFRLSPNGTLSISPILKNDADKPTVLATTCYMLSLAMQHQLQKGKGQPPTQPSPGAALLGSIAAALPLGSLKATALGLGALLVHFVQPHPQAVTVRCVCVSVACGHAGSRGRDFSLTA